MGSGAILCVCVCVCVLCFFGGDNGKEHGSYWFRVLGFRVWGLGLYRLYRNNGKVNGNYYSAVIQGLEFRV